MPEQLWPLILVVLLAGLVASSFPYLVTFDPARPEGKFVRLVSDLARIQDFRATVELYWDDQRPGVKAEVMWLRGEGAFRVALEEPPVLAGQVFTYQGGQLNHFLPAGEDVEAGVVISDLSRPWDELSERYLEEFDPQQLITALRLGTLRASQSQGKTVTLEVAGQFPNLEFIRRVSLELRPPQREPYPTLADLLGITLVYLEGGKEGRFTLRLSNVQINTGLRLHTVREFPAPYNWILPAP